MNGQNPGQPQWGQPPPGFQGFPPPGQQPQQPQQPMQPQQPPQQQAPAPSGGGGRSRVLPIMVAAGLACGVFAGLLLVRGTGHADEGDTVASSDEVKPDETKPDETKPDETKPDVVKPDETKPDETKPDVVKPDETKPDEVKPDEAGVKPDEVKPDEVKPDEVKPDEVKPDVVKPAVLTEARLTVTVTPADADDLKVTVDDQPYAGPMTIALDKGKKRVTVVVRAKGYRKYSKRVTLTKDYPLKVKLRKPTKKKPPTGPGNLIDL